MLGHTTMPVPVLDTALNPKKHFELTSTRVKWEFFFNAQRLLRDWFTTHPSTPVPLHTDVGEMTMLPPSMANEIRNKEHLSFSQWAMKAFHGNLPGFDGFREIGQDSGIVQAVIANDLAKYLNKVTEPLADETSVAVRELLTDNEEWHTIRLSGIMVALICHIASRVFLGEKLCRNEEWLRITQSYTIDGFLAMTELRMWPAAIYPILRTQVSKSRKVKQPILEERRQLKEGLILSVGAIHTTSDLTCQTMTHLVQNPEIWEPLRKGIVDTLQQHGWKKTALYNMKLLDSVIRESRILKPVTKVSMRRMVLQEVKLSDGTVIPKNGMLASQAQPVTTAPENLASGHGKHACPGRFFAANEVKIVFIFLLLRYDWKLLEGMVPRILSGEFGMELDPTLKLEVRRRREEMEI
ncbi:cytochrome P450 monooxygenase [Aspergillus piperis CBS 112811]|uniref:Cytochrome P450 monooxygenase n=1 Tax=Aspergillus piperis CBS 112811 TaxID=1448313 RepID=A0A8G1R3E3_9EURO|nr:cytochrome P450 monooxygenase [Aspergillus piperis CBS 112811]RAH58518.1 cytochrome P450 monooxygenase [Aspergillus piperis CBS 112811]